MNRKAHLFARLLGVLVFVLTSSVNAEDSSESSKPSSSKPSTSASLTPASQIVIATVGKSLSTSAFKAAKFGSTSVTYSIQPTPPQGLTLNARTGVLSGTPTVVAGQANYVVTGQSSSAQAKASITLTVVQSGGNTTPTSG